MTDKRRYSKDTRTPLAGALVWLMETSVYLILKIKVSWQQHITVLQCDGCHAFSETCNPYVYSAWREATYE